MIAKQLFVLVVLGTLSTRMVLGQQVCTAFVPAAGIPNPDPVAQQCGETWLLERLRRFNSTQFAEYVSQSNNQLAPVLDLACTLPSGSCSPCTQAYAAMYEFLASAPQPITPLKFTNSTYEQLAGNIGTACGTTRNPYQVFHPSADTNTACNLCARAFTNQFACTNTAANQNFGLLWWPFYPQPPNSHYPGAVGDAAVNWSTSTVCQCFTQSLPAALGTTELDDLGVCLWVYYQSEPSLTWAKGVAPITSTL